MRGSPFVFSNFQTGVNLEAAPYFLDAGQARGALNVHSAPTGAIVKRPGCTFEAELMTVEPKGAWPCQLAAGDRVLIHAGSDFYYYAPGSKTVTKLTKPEGISATADWEWVQAVKSTEKSRGPFFGVNGTNTPLYWDGSSSEVKLWKQDDESAVPNGKIITFWENKVWIAKGSTVYWCDVINPGEWDSPKGGSTQFDPEDGEEITAFGKVGGYLAVFKEHKTFLITEPIEASYRQISGDIGCISPRSVVSTAAGLFFMSPDREIILTNGQAFNRKVSEEINPLIASSGSLRKACAIAQKEKVFFSFPTDEDASRNSAIVEYDMNNTAWWIHKVKYGEEEIESKKSDLYGGVRQFCVLDPENLESMFALGMGGEKGKVSYRVIKFLDKTDLYKDGEFPFEWNWESPWHVFTYPHIKKRYREIRVDSLGNFNLYNSFSFSKTRYSEEDHIWDQANEEGEEGEWGKEEGSSKWGEGSEEELWGGERGVITERRFYTPGEGRALSMKFQGEDLYPLEIYAYTIAVNYRKD